MMDEPQLPIPTATESGGHIDFLFDDPELRTRLGAWIDTRSGRGSHLEVWSYERWWYGLGDLSKIREHGAALIALANAIEGKLAAMEYRQAQGRGQEARASGEEP